MTAASPSRIANRGSVEATQTGRDRRAMAAQGRASGWGRGRERRVASSGAIVSDASRTFFTRRRRATAAKRCSALGSSERGGGTKRTARGRASRNESGEWEWGEEGGRERAVRELPTSRRR